MLADALLVAAAAAAAAEAAAAASRFACGADQTKARGWHRVGIHAASSAAQAVLPRGAKQMVRLSPRASPLSPLAAPVSSTVEGDGGAWRLMAGLLWGGALGGVWCLLSTRAAACSADRSHSGISSMISSFRR